MEKVPTNKTGWLEKTGGKTQVVKKHQKRWCVLTADRKTLEYFESDATDCKRSGNIDLPEALNIHASGKDFAIEIKGRTYDFRATSADEAQHWVDALIAAKDYVPGRPTRGQAPPEVPAFVTTSRGLGKKDSMAKITLGDSKATPPERPHRKSGIFGSGKTLDEGEEDGDKKDDKKRKKEG